jgi:pyruvate,orthophosphate dikinase
MAHAVCSMDRRLLCNRSPALALSYKPCLAGPISIAGSVFGLTRIDLPMQRSPASSVPKALDYAGREHMFFEPERLLAVRCALLSETQNDRQPWLDQLLPMQQADFEGLFQEMDGLPVTIRLLDWPLHEFMPQTERELETVSQALAVHPAALKRRVEALHEANPMLGHRGVRFGLTHPDVYRMQVQAIVRAALRCQKNGVRVEPEIMLPLVVSADEMRVARQRVDDAAKGVFEEMKATIAYKVGTMLETPRACIVADEIAKYAEFCSFGTNDLTQTTFGISRDDAGQFLPDYMGEGLSLLAADPFSTLDADGVGEMLRIAVEKARRTRPGYQAWHMW